MFLSNISPYSKGLTVAYLTGEGYPFDADDVLHAKIKAIYNKPLQEGCYKIRKLWHKISIQIQLCVVSFLYKAGYFYSKNDLLLLKDIQKYQVGLSRLLRIGSRLPQDITEPGLPPTKEWMGGGELPLFKEYGQQWAETIVNIAQKHGLDLMLCISLSADKINATQTKEAPLVAALFLRLMIDQIKKPLLNQCTEALSMGKLQQVAHQIFLCTPRENKDETEILDTLIQETQEKILRFLDSMERCIREKLRQKYPLYRSILIYKQRHDAYMRTLTQLTKAQTTLQNVQSLSQETIQDTALPDEDRRKLLIAIQDEIQSSEGLVQQLTQRRAAQKAHLDATLIDAQIHQLLTLMTRAHEIENRYVSTWSRLEEIIHHFSPKRVKNLNLLEKSQEIDGKIFETLDDINSNAVVE